MCFLFCVFRLVKGTGVYKRKKRLHTRQTDNYGFYDINRCFPKKVNAFISGTVCSC